jgi:hypothetical protein
MFMETRTVAEEELRQKQIALDAWRDLAARYRQALISIQSSLSPSQRGYAQIIGEALGNGLPHLHATIQTNPAKSSPAESGRFQPQGGE